MPWYRLGRGVVVGPDTVTAPLVWWPHLGGATFESFRGELSIRVVGRRVVFGIAGKADGGELAQTNAILTELLRLIGVAVGAVDPPVG